MSGDLLEDCRQALHEVERIAGVLGSAKVRNPDACVMPWADLGDVFKASALAVTALERVIPILESGGSQI